MAMKMYTFWLIVFLSDCPLAAAVSDHKDTCSDAFAQSHERPECVLPHGRASSGSLLQVGASAPKKKDDSLPETAQGKAPWDGEAHVSAMRLAFLGQVLRSHTGRWEQALVEGHDDNVMGAAFILMILTVLGSFALLSWFTMSGESGEISRKPDIKGLPPQMPPLAQHPAAHQVQTSPKTPLQSRPGTEAQLQPQPRLLPEPQRASQLLQRQSAQDATSPPLPPKDDLRPPTSGQPKSQHLCPGLVVPGGTECALAVRVPPPALGVSKTSDFAIDIVDLSGKPVLKAEVCRGTDATSPSLSKARTWSGASIPRRNKQQKPVVTLKTLQPAGGSAVIDRRPGRPSSSNLLGDSSALAYCYLAKGMDGSVGIDICKASGSLFGTLVRDESRPRYIMQTESPGVALFFDGIFEDHAVLMTDDMQEPLADAEPCSMTFDVAGKFYKLRASSSVDVGLLLCCLMSIDELQSRT